VTAVTEQLRIGVFFGSRSVEHEVSVITAQQAMAAMPADRFVPVPVYIAKSGAWYTGDHLLQLERYKDIDRLIAASTRVTMRPDPTSGGELVEVDARRGLLGGANRAVARQFGGSTNPHNWERAYFVAGFSETVNDQPSLMPRCCRVAISAVDNCPYDAATPASDIHNTAEISFTGFVIMSSFLLRALLALSAALCTPLERFK